MTQNKVGAGATERDQNGHFFTGALKVNTKTAGVNTLQLQQRIRRVVQLAQEIIDLW